MTIHYKNSKITNVRSTKIGISNELGVVLYFQGEICGAIEHIDVSELIINEN